MGAGTPTRAVTGAVGVFPIHCFGFVRVSVLGYFAISRAFLA